MKDEAFTTRGFVVNNSAMLSLYSGEEKGQEMELRAANVDNNTDKEGCFPNILLPGLARNEGGTLSAGKRRRKGTGRGTGSRRTNT